MSEDPFNPTTSYVLQHTTRRVRAFVNEINYRIDVDTLHREETETLRLNEIGRVKVTTTQPLVFDSYRLNRATGNFILIDPASNTTVAAGMSRRRARTLEEVLPKQLERPTSTNVVWESSQITRDMREKQNGHRAAVLWFTGLSGSGKSTVARQLERRLFALGCRTFYLDGDNVRHGLNGDLGFSDAARKENIRRVAEVAKLSFEHGNLTICTFISPFAADRDFARTLLPEGRFIEVFVKCDIEVCKRRDPKGLYARALRGEIPEFTGVTSPYEEPQQPELIVETDLRSADELVEEILAYLIRQGLVAESS
jgi:bifunctional enzyme CysN/CysC